MWEGEGEVHSCPAATTWPASLIPELEGMSDSWGGGDGGGGRWGGGGKEMLHNLYVSDRKIKLSL